MYWLTTVRDANSVFNHILGKVGLKKLAPYQFRIDVPLIFGSWRLSEVALFRAIENNAFEMVDGRVA